jgi:hypothetical protein
MTTMTMFENERYQRVARPIVPHPVMTTMTEFPPKRMCHRWSSPDAAKPNIAMGAGRKRKEKRPERGARGVSSAT